MSLPAVLLSSAMQILLDCASYVPFGSFHSPLACCATFAAAAKEAEDENFSSAGTLRKRPLRHHLDIETFIRFSSLLTVPAPLVLSPVSPFNHSYSPIVTHHSYSPIKTHRCVSPRHNLEDPPPLAHSSVLRRRSGFFHTGSRNGRRRALPGRGKAPPSKFPRCRADRPSIQLARAPMPSPPLILIVRRTRTCTFHVYLPRVPATCSLAWSPVRRHN